MTDAAVPTPHAVFTARSLQACLEQTLDARWFESPTAPDTAQWNVLTDERAGARFLVHRDDPPDVPRIVVVCQDGTLLGAAGSNASRTVFERAHRVALEAAHPPVILPDAWSSYQHGNLVAFFACPREEGSLRWVCEIHPRASGDTCFWKLTTGDRDQIALERFDPPSVVYDRIAAVWPEAYAQIAEAFASLPADPTTAALQAIIDLDATTFGAVTRHRTFSTWLEALTPAQRQFVDAAPSTAVKIRGAAGSGKTLALELKALRELYRARDRGEPTRILFATHSWAMAEQVDSALQQLDESWDTDAIEVYPLVSLAQSVLPAERSGHGFDLLGEDSLTGKRLQIDRIDALVESLRRGDWLTFRAKASPSFAARMDTERRSAERNALVWDLMVEFACVLSANGILPGINAERQYLALPRSPWMVPLEAPADRLFVLLVYERYVNSLREAKLLTSDQLINDLLNYLETFAWNIRREESGYDLIFVDELHLFSEQERLALHYLTRDAGRYPRMFMALDPRQSPAEMYVDIAPGAVTRSDSGTADTYLGDIHSVDLTVVHRFTPEILALVRHVNLSFPALDLGEDWELDLTDVTSSVDAGTVPTIVRHSTRHDAMTGALERGLDLARTATGEDRAAVIVLEPGVLHDFKTQVVAEGTSHVSIIESRDDVDRLRYSRRSVVVGAAEYLGGLQFKSVLICGLPDSGGAFANLGHHRRRVLSLLYLAISRATSLVEIHVSDDAGGIPGILEAAVAAGVAQLGD